MFRTQIVPSPNTQYRVACKDQTKLNLGIVPKGASVCFSPPLRVVMYQGRDLPEAPKGSHIQVCICRVVEADVEGCHVGGNRQPPEVVETTDSFF
jgi:hypothetical protein